MLYKMLTQKNAKKPSYKAFDYEDDLKKEMNEVKQKNNVKDSSAQRTEFNVAPGSTSESVDMTVTEHRDRYV